MRRKRGSLEAGGKQGDDDSTKAWKHRNAEAWKQGTAETQKCGSVRASHAPDNVVAQKTTPIPHPTHHDFPVSRTRPYPEEAIPGRGRTQKRPYPEKPYSEQAVPSGRGQLEARNRPYQTDLPPPYSGWSTNTGQRILPCSGCPQSLQNGLEKIFRTS